MKKTTAIFLLILSVVLIVAGIALRTVPLGGSYEKLLSDTTGSITGIEAELLSSSLRVYKSWDGKTLEIDGSGRASGSVALERHGDTLALTERSPRGLARLFSPDRYNDYVAIWLPEDYHGSLTLSSVSGEVSLSSLALPDVTASLSTVSGEVSVYESRLSSLIAETVSGDIWVDSVVAGRVKLTSVSGGILGSAGNENGEPVGEASSVSGHVSFNPVYP